MNNYIAFLVAILGIAMGYTLRHWVAQKRVKSSEKRASELLRKAKEETQQILLQAKKKTLDELDKVKQEERQRQKQLSRHEERLSVREERVEKDLKEIDGLYSRLEEFEKELSTSGRIFLRYSGTEPLARVMIEGKSKEQIEVMATELASIIRNSIGDDKCQG